MAAPPPDLDAVVDAYLQNGQIDLAIRELERAVRTLPTDLKPRTRLADLYARLGRFERASDEYLFVARRQAALGRDSQAAAVAKQMLRLPLRSATVLSLGDLFDEHGLFSEAERHLFETARERGQEEDVPELAEVLQKTIARYESRPRTGEAIPSLATFAFRR